MRGQALPLFSIGGLSSQNGPSAGGYAEADLRVSGFHSTNTVDESGTGLFVPNEIKEKRAYLADY